MTADLLAELVEAKREAREARSLLEAVREDLRATRRKIASGEAISGASMITKLEHRVGDVLEDFAEAEELA